MKPIFSRRRFLKGSVLGAGITALTACDRVTQLSSVSQLLDKTEKLTMKSQRLLQPDNTLAKQFSQEDISEPFPANGTRMPTSEEYQHFLKTDFESWHLEVDGLVEHPQSFSLADLRKFPSRTQITRHDCVEGWSAIGKWKGVPLGLILNIVRLKTNARYVVFYCADELERTFDGSGRYYESIDLVDAFHPQTILAYEMNDQKLPVQHGAPLRLRVERQLGYKHAKFLMRMEVVESFGDIWGGKGGYWEDRGYEWYAGI